MLLFLEVAEELEAVALALDTAAEELEAVALALDAAADELAEALAEAAAALFDSFICKS